MVADARPSELFSAAPGPLALQHCFQSVCRTQHQRRRTHMRKTLSFLTLAAGVLAAPAAQADITIGFVTSLSGNGSSIGIPYGRGINAAYEYKKTINGETIRLIQLDDGSDPSAATRNARKLVEEEKVDLLIGTATAPSTIAMAAVAAELKVPMIAVSPVVGQPNAEDQWGI